MTVVNFAYDDEVGRQITWRWHYNTYDKKFYPINGVFEDCYYDYHAPLQTVFEQNEIQTKSITLKNALKSNEKFVYVLTFRYLRNTILEDLEYNFFDHLPNGLIRAVNSGQCILVLNDAHESAFYTQEFYNQILWCLKKTRLDRERIILITGNPSNEVSLSPLKLIFWQYFETAVRLATKDLVIADDRYTDSVLLKKFLCLNRIPREPRYFFMYEMHRRKLLDDFRASLDKVKSVDDIVSYNNNAFLNAIKDKEDFSNMLSTLPWIVDSKDFEINHWDTNKESFASNNLIFITTETLVKGDMNNLFLTEKTFKPISLKMPFIIIGQPGTLSRLKSLGYKTFETVWDESYDQELNPILRMYKICDLVEHLAKFSIDDLKRKIINIQDILNHNYNLLNTRIPEVDIIKAIKEKL